jgi:hypothetical protein
VADNEPNQGDKAAAHDERTKGETRYFKASVHVCILHYLLKFKLRIPWTASK